MFLLPARAVSSSFPLCQAHHSLLQNQVGAPFVTSSGLFLVLVAMCSSGWVLCCLLYQACLNPKQPTAVCKVSWVLFDLCLFGLHSVLRFRVGSLLLLLLVSSNHPVFCPWHATVFCNLSCVPCCSCCSWFLCLSGLLVSVPSRQATQYSWQLTAACKLRCSAACVVCL